MAALAAKGLVGRCWGRAGAAVRVVHAVFLVLLQAVEEEGAFETHLLDPAIQALDALSCAIVVLFNVVDAPAQLDALAVVGGFDGWWKVLLRECSRCCGTLVSGVVYLGLRDATDLGMRHTLLRHVCR